MKSELKQETKKSIQNVYTNFISDFSQGTDLIFADIIMELPRKYPIQLMVLNSRRMTAEPTEVQLT